MLDQSRPKIEAVLFDVGGPIDMEIASEAGHEADIREGLRLEGVTVSDAKYAAAERWAVEHFVPDLYQGVIWRLTGADGTIARRVHSLFQEKGTARRLSGDLGEFELRPGIIELFVEVKARGLRIGLAANQPSSALKHLSQLGLGEYLDSASVTGTHGLRKPDTRLFLHTCDELGVAPEACIMIGDRIDNDIAPARLLGMKTILFRTGRHRNQQPRSWQEMPDFEVDDVAGLRKALWALCESENERTQV